MTLFTKAEQQIPILRDEVPGAGLRVLQRGDGIDVRVFGEGCHHARQRVRLHYDIGIHEGHDLSL